MKLNKHFRSALLEAIPCAIFILDADGRVIFWNASAQLLTGYEADEMTGLTCEAMRLRLARHQDPTLLETMCPFRMAGGGGWDEECEICRKDGSLVPVVRKASAVHDDAGTQIGTIVALVDVSLVKQQRSELANLTREMARSGRFGRLVGSSPPMRRLYEQIEQIAQTDASVVIEGETGTGKELVARAIHAAGGRAGGVFLPVNCGALPETLLEAELFGHVRGAFTGAVADRAGRFEEATGGTLFLDEIAEMPLPSQVKLLRVLQDGEVTRIGESRPRRVYPRILAATNRDLAAAVKAGRFREDLFYRLRVVGLHVPPLRQRREDIAELVAHFIERFNGKYKLRVTALAPEAMDRLMAYDWPGNVRELEHALEHAFVVTDPAQKVIDARCLPPEIQPAGRRTAAAPAAAPLSVPADADEAAQVAAALEQAGGNKTQAARLLGITRAGLYKKLRRLELTERLHADSMRQEDAPERQPGANSPASPPPPSE